MPQEYLKYYIIWDTTTKFSRIGYDINLNYAIRPSIVHSTWVPDVLLTWTAYITKSGMSGVYSCIKMTSHWAVLLNYKHYKVRNEIFIHW